MKKIAIIGAGISGLYFANLLKNNSSYRFSIFEKKPELNFNNGYGIQLSANTVKLLNEIGFDKIDSNEIYHPKKINFFSADYNHKICELDITFFNNDLEKYSTLKRTKLIKFLAKNFLKDKIKFNSELTDINCNKYIELTFKDNYKECFDYLVCSDGIFSKTKSIIFNKLIYPKYSKSIALRGTIKNCLSEDISLYMGSNFHYVIYPVNQSNECNFISIIRKKISSDQIMDNNSFSDNNYINSIIDDLSNKVPDKIISKLEDIKIFPIFVSEKIKIPQKENIYFIGDALFTSQPTFAQGASQSVEAAKELFNQIENNQNSFYKKRLNRFKSINWRSKFNYFFFHLSNPITVFFRNLLLKILIKNKRFLSIYLGKVYKN